ncbi:tyrosine-protein phosphatase [Ureibacillus thermosphaericus]|uniref:tyrosine-protein phosphatase n=1 Tax=Ureibacillus thermosphaericus TaxID=51173 RepID=UPI000BBCEC0B|nr:CpsB/CapC family capsule biosynthesis tyrosine phosphatase [Ureibacillus thermosphaericus]
MIDIHSHILYGVDDGPKTFEESITMLETAAAEGITDIISTSHASHPQFDVSSNDVIEQVQELQNELEIRQVPLTIHIGHEARISETIVERCLTKQTHLLANSNYLLLELPSSTVPPYTINIIRELLIHDITPIIAHPERNKSIAEKPARLERLIREGAVAQVTAGSLAGHFGRSVQQLSLDLVRANLVHTYGSDVHHLTTRPFLFNEGLSFLEKKKELDAIDILLENNARILANKPFIIYEPEEIQKRKWWNIF